MREDEVYISTRDHLRQTNWTILGGQPPSGCDHLPVIEIKSGSVNRGSLNAYKPDLVAFKSRCLLLVECKPRFDPRDQAKLLAVLDSEVRKQALVSEIKQRHLCERHGISFELELAPAEICACLAFAGESHADAKISCLLFNRNASGPTVVLQGVAAESLAKKLV